MSSPLIAILMSVHNEQRYLPAALKSLQRQTCTDWELVVVDDGSSDNTPQILAEYAKKDQRIQVLSPGRIGLIDALNLGLEQCHAPLLARMDGDDICHPRRLEAQRSALIDDPELSVVSCRVRHFPRPDLTDGMLAYIDWLNSHLDHDDIVRDLYVESPFANPSVMLRTDDLKRVDGYHDTGWAEDYDLWLRMAASGARFKRLDDELFFWRDHPDRLTRTSDMCSLESFRSCKAHHLCNGYLSGCKDVTLWGAGLEGKAWRKTLLEEGIHIRRWIEIDPNKVGQTIHDAPVKSIDTLAPGQGPMLITIGAKGARSQVREFANTRGLLEGIDYICVT